jgi:hypothetical protein
MKKISLLHACLIGFLCLLFSHQTVLAHEHITIGDYEFVVGWMDEPPIAGQKNAVVMTVSDMSSGEPRPVEDISSLTVSVSYGGQVKLLGLQSVSADLPGQFMAPILPTVPGEYAILLRGQLGKARTRYQGIGCCGWRSRLGSSALDSVQAHIEKRVKPLSFSFFLQQL